MKKILLVDDERIFHFLSTKIIEVSGIACDVQSAFDGKEALQKIHDGFAPDYIFVDLDMPTMNGFQFVEKFRSDKSKLSTKVIVLSSSITDDERQRALTLGADAYMSKPLEEENVRQLLAD
jgi:CheY-like chemotaxis protein